MTQWKIAFVIGIIMFVIGLPLFIASGQENLGMLIPGAILFGAGAAVVIVAAAIGMGFGKRATTSEQDPASKNWWED
jgi:membrane-bound ClpP family serine protease